MSFELNVLTPPGRSLIVLVGGSSDKRTSRKNSLAMSSEEPAKTEQGGLQGMILIKNQPRVEPVFAEAGLLRDRDLIVDFANTGLQTHKIGCKAAGISVRRNACQYCNTVGSEFHIDAGQFRTLRTELRQLDGV